MRASRTPPAPFARLSLFDGAELLHGDLRDIVGHEARMVGLHVLAAHRTWGIALGLTASIDPGGTIVTIAEGAAFTRRGDVLAVATVSIPAPTIATPGVARPTFDLVLRASDTRDTHCVRTIACDGIELVVPRVELHWSVAHPVAGSAPLLGDDVRLGDDIPIARFVRQPDGTLVGPDGSERRVVRGFVRPHVAFGQTRAGELTWSDGQADIWVHIDTSEAGFSTTPVYIATIAGVTTSAALVGPWLHVEHATASGFIARLVGAAVPPQPGPLQRGFIRAAARTATIAWTGIESSHACSTRLLSIALFAAFGGTT